MRIRRLTLDWMRVLIWMRVLMAMGEIVVSDRIAEELRDLERLRMIQALDAADGNQSRGAKLIQTPPFPTMPSAADPRQPAPEEAVTTSEVRSAHRTPVDGQLLPGDEKLDLEVSGVRPEPGHQEPKKKGEDEPHGRRPYRSNRAAATSSACGLVGDETTVIPGSTE